MGGVYFKLTTSVDLSGHDWEPIATGNHGQPTDKFVSWFCGNFDGDGHIISNMTCNGSSTTIYGLFSGIKNGSVKDLSIGGNITTKSRGGGVCYVVNGAVTIDNVHSFVNQTYSTEGLSGGIYGICLANSTPVIKNCTNSGSITLTAAKSVLGGIAGGGVDTNATADISNCINYGDITSAGFQIGGICASFYKEGSIKDCTNYGDIISNYSADANNYAGGIISFCRNKASTLINLTNYGDVTSKNNCVGGILGSAESQKHTLSSCENYGAITGNNMVGGIVGSGKVLSVSECVNHGDVTSTGTAGDNSGTGGICATAYKATLTSVVNYGNITGNKMVAGIAGNGQQGKFVDVCNFGNIKGKAGNVAGVIGQFNENASMSEVANYGNVENTSANVNTGLLYGYQGIGSTVDMTGAVIKGRLTSNGVEKFTLGYTNCVEIKLVFNGEIYAYDNMQPGETYTPRTISPELDPGYRLSDWYSDNNLTTKYVGEPVGTSGTNTNNALNFSIYCKAIKGYDLLLSDIDDCDTCTEYERVGEFREDISYLTDAEQEAIMEEIVDVLYTVEEKLNYMYYLSISNANLNSSVFSVNNANYVLVIAVTISVLAAGMLLIVKNRKNKAK